MTHIDENIQSKNYSLKSSLSYFHVEFQVSRGENVASARRVVRFSLLLKYLQWEKILQLSADHHAGVTALQHRFLVPGLVSSTPYSAPTPNYGELVNTLFRK